MLEINERIRIPDSEFAWKYARSGGPGGQNVNKVASKAILIWPIAQSPSVPEEVKIRLALLFKRYFTNEGVVMIASQRHRDQDRNKQDCLEKLTQILLEACHVPRVRKQTKPTRGSKQRRVEAKKHRASIKGARRVGRDD